MARRRTRHRLITDKGTLDVLAFSRERALAVAEQHGYTVIGAVAPVRRQVERVPASAAKWAKDERAIRAAIAQLGIRRPVNIKLTGHKGGRNGAYTTRGHGHNITVKNWLTPEQATETLWHELRHAYQFEQCVGPATGTAALALWRSYPGRRGSYENRPMERDARSYAAKNRHIPLTRAR